MGVTSRGYEPGIPPNEYSGPWLQDELRELARALSETLALELRVTNAIPVKPREGMIVYADGTNWNPGSGKGWYGFNGSAWVLIKAA